MYENSMTGLKHNSYMFPVLQKTKIIIWDEVPMQHKYDIVKATGVEDSRRFLS